MEAALKLLDLHGPEGVTIRAVARETNVSHAAPVNHFKDRRALLTEVVIRLFSDLQTQIHQEIQRTEALPDHRVALFARVLIDYGFKHARRYDLMWRCGLIDMQDLRLQEVMDEIYGQLTAEIAALNKESCVDHDTVALTFWSVAHGYVTMRLSGVFEERRDSVSGQPRQDALLEFLLAALRHQTTDPAPVSRDTSA